MMCDICTLLSTIKIVNERGDHRGNGADAAGDAQDAVVRVYDDIVEYLKNEQRVSEEGS